MLFVDSALQLMNSSFRLLFTSSIIIAAPLVRQPAFAQMTLISEVRSVTASYYGTGSETHFSTGTFGLFEASAIGTPFGGGYVLAAQISTITPSEITIVHHAVDMYGPGGEARSDFELRFQLLAATRLTMNGYCNMLSGFISLKSDSFGVIPVIWHGGPGDPANDYPNYLDFDQVLPPGLYTLSSFEVPREVVTTRIDIHAFSVPDSDSTAFLLAMGMLSLGAIGRHLRRTCHSIPTNSRPSD